MISASDVILVAANLAPGGAVPLADLPSRKTYGAIMAREAAMVVMLRCLRLRPSDVARALDLTSSHVANVRKRLEQDPSRRRRVEDLAWKVWHLLDEETAQPIRVRRGKRLRDDAPVSVVPPMLDEPSRRTLVGPPTTARILAIMRAQASRSWLASDLLGYMPGVKSRTVHSALLRLAERGQVQRIDTGGRGKRNDPKHLYRLPQAARAVA